MLSKPKNPPSFAEACIVSADKRWKGGLIATTGDRHDDERTVHHRYHLLIKIYFHGSSVSTPARSEIVQMQRESPRDGEGAFDRDGSSARMDSKSTIGRLNRHARQRAVRTSTRWAIILLIN
jgi:hypothetical protein